MTKISLIVTRRFQKFSKYFSLGAVAQREETTTLIDSNIQLILTPVDSNIYRETFQIPNEQQ